MGYIPWPRKFDLEWARKKVARGRLFWKVYWATQLCVWLMIVSLLGLLCYTYP